LELVFGGQPKVPIDLFVQALVENSYESVLEECEAQGKANPKELIIEPNSELYAYKMKLELYNA
jgi:hypothetical protein